MGTTSGREPRDVASPRGNDADVRKRPARRYKHAVAASTVDVTWKVEWFVEDPEGDGQTGSWTPGTVLYYGRLANVVYARPDGAADLVEVGVDEHLRLLEVVEDSGRADFEELVVEGIVQWRGPGGDEEQEEEDPVAAVARRPAKALGHNLETLDRLAADMGRCLEDALRMRCASDVEQAEAAARLRKHVVCGDLDALNELELDAARDARADLAARRAEAQDATLQFVARCEARFWRAASTGLFFRRRYRPGDEVDVALCRGLETCRGVVARAHDDETYDVDLEGDRPEVGVQIPPERRGRADTVLPDA